jgi:hypothetical protein
MKRVLAFTLVLLTSFSFGFATPTARLSNPSLSQASSRAPRTANAEKVVVVVESEHLTGVLSDGRTIEVRLKAELKGDNPSSLTGEGRSYSSTGAHNYWPATGAITGAVVTLSGTVTDSNVAFLIGSPLTVVADSTTGQIIFHFGPYAGGPFVGHIDTFTGTGRVKIKGAD